MSWRRSFRCMGGRGRRALGSDRLLLPEEYGKNSVPLYDALDAYNLAIEPEENNVMTDHGHACIFANVRPQLVPLRTLPDAIDLCTYLSNEGHCAAGIVGRD